jgi:hypothetical protein
MNEQELFKLALEKQLREHHNVKNKLLQDLEFVNSQITIIQQSLIKLWGG